MGFRFALFGLFRGQSLSRGGVVMLCVCWGGVGLDLTSGWPAARRGSLGWAGGGRATTCGFFG